ncbi:MAG: putative Tau tubulin kinase 1 [Streblomastix strix]|uniref:Putative Tau tubulin kinase 1 n=1 Tax=Streblomastix strix TaxID=222440 RepID=A0A5J4WMQ2_9EUKA|nr:MAG: putative Tau tubulin kinase 1 [Streblomastix strix]
MDILPLCAEVPFKTGDVIKQVYQLQQQLGTRAHNMTFSALYNNGTTTKHVAIKIEKNLPQFTLQSNEVFIMKAMENCKHFAKFYQCGTHEDYKFVAMELLGPSLIQLANRRHPCKFNLQELLKFGIQAIESLKELHKAGFVHRNVKPDNFVIGNQQNSSGFIYLIDFGLCKKINKENGVIVKPLQISNF